MMKRAIAPFVFALFVGCGGGAQNTPPPNANVPPAGPASTTSAQTVGGGPIDSPLPTALDEAKHDLEAAKNEKDPREKCRYLHDAVTLDGKSIEARRAWGESRCAPARELLPHVRAVFDAKKNAETGALLAVVASRAASSEDALDGADAIAKEAKDGGNVDLDALRLAAKTYAKFGRHADAARVYERIAAERAGKGATLEALDARLDGAMESARAKGQGTTVSPRADLLAAIDAAAPHVAEYGNDWIAPKVIDAIAVLRTSGDVAGANDAVKAVRAKKMLEKPEAKHALDVERAIAAARGGDGSMLKALVNDAKNASQVGVAQARALLAVAARFAKKCGVARAHARAHDVLLQIAESSPTAEIAKTLHASPRFDDDVEWARACGGDSEPGESVATIASALRSPEVDDAIEVGRLDAIRGRTILQSLLDAHPDDVAARVALAGLLSPSDAIAVIETGLKKSPGELALHRAKLDRLQGKARADEGAEIAKVVLPATIEVYDDARAAVPVLADIVSKTPEDEAAGTSNAVVANALLKACNAKPTAAACVDDGGKAIERAVRLARTFDSKSLADAGPSLCDADLKSPLVRLSIVLALLDAKQTAKAAAIVDAKRGKWEVPEAGLAAALVAAEKKDCVTARNKLAQWPGLMADKQWAPEIQRVKDTCKLQ